MSDTLLEANGLRYTYPDGTAALRGVDLAVRRGERVGLVGPNGSGKSTLLMCLSGLFAPEGNLRVGEVALSSGNRVRALAGRVGLVFQSPDDQLFMPTLADDLAFGPINLGLRDAEVRERVEQTAERMALTDLLDRAPHHLSMGQKRNAAIAAVLTMRPELLLMDEPSSNLDPRSRRRLIDTLGGIDTTWLIASHDLALIGQLCTRTVLLDEGVVVTDGPTGELLRDQTLMERHGLEVWHNGQG